MREYVISESEAGLSLLKYASKMLQNAPKGLIHKFLRNKNIDLNGGRADAHRVLSPGDRVAFFLSDETFDRFHDAGEESISYELTLEPERVLYEDDEVIRYLRYDRLSKNGKCCLYVYYEDTKDGSADTRILDMYAYDTETGEVIDSGRRAWADVGTPEYREATGE